MLTANNKTERSKDTVDGYSTMTSKCQSGVALTADSESHQREPPPIGWHYFNCMFQGELCRFVFFNVIIVWST